MSTDRIRPIQGLGKGSVVLPKFLKFSWPILLGLVVAAIGTTFHQVTTDGFPLGAALSLIVATIFAANFRAQSESKAPAFMYALSASAIVSVAGLSITDDVLVPANLAGNLWAFGLITLTVIAALWPKTKG